MPRADAKFNQVEDLLKTMLSAIDSTADANSWLTKPRTVAIGFSFGDWMGGPRPALYIQTMPWDFADSSTRHLYDMRVGVLCVVDGTIPGLRQLNKLQADVVYAIIRQPSSEYPFLADGDRVQRIVILQGDPSDDRRDASGLAVSLITLGIKLPVNHTAAT